MHRTSILIVDDDKTLVNFLFAALETEGWELFAAYSGDEALRFLNKMFPDLILLDIMLPEIDGIELCRRIRKTCSVPMIMLSGRTEYETKLECLKIGAEDYITKPFGVDELTMRIKTVLKHNYHLEDASAKSADYGDLRIDFSAKRVVVRDREVKLTPTEYKLLQELVTNEGKVLSHPYLLNTIWGPEYQTEKEYLHVYIGHLRSKLESDPLLPKHIISIPSMGYVFKANS